MMVPFLFIYGNQIANIFGKYLYGVSLGLVHRFIQLMQL
jgi:hypothetical protein